MEGQVGWEPHYQALRDWPQDAEGPSPGKAGLQPIWGPHPLGIAYGSAPASLSLPPLLSFLFFSPVQLFPSFPSLPLLSYQPLFSSPILLSNSPFTSPFLLSSSFSLLSNSPSQLFPPSFPPSSPRARRSAPPSVRTSLRPHLGAAMYNACSGSAQ